MKLNIDGNFEYYTFESLEKIDFIGHCFTSRHGGVSTGYLESLNLRAFQEAMNRKMLIKTLI